MAIENRDLAVGTRLVARYKGTTHHATVVRGQLKDGVYVTVTEEGEPNTLGYRLDDGRGYKSLSAAGSAIMGGQACNGWRFWSVEKEDAQPSKQPKAEGETESGTQSADGAQTTAAFSPAPKPKGKRRAKASTEPAVDCHCDSFAEGTESCKWRESGDCQDV